MKSGYEAFNPVPATIQPRDAVIYAHAQFGVNLHDHIAIEALKILMTRSDSILFNETEIASRACDIAAAMLRRMP